MPYRDGLAAARDSFRQAKGRVFERSAPLDSKVRFRLPDGLRRELAALEDELEKTPETIDDVRRAERLLDQYELSMSAALMLAEQERAIRLRRASWVPVAGLVIGSSLVVWWGYELYRRYDSESLDCQATEKCRSAGLCHPRWSDVIYDRAVIECVAYSQADCEEPCSISGRCHYVYDACRADSDDECRQSERCRERGECWLHRASWRHNSGTLGVCSIRSHHDCKQSQGCSEEGRCGVGVDECVPESDGDCAQSAACLRDGRCRLGYHECIASEERDCARSIGCERDGRCCLGYHECIGIKDSDFARSVECWRDGRCGVILELCEWARWRDDYVVIDEM